MILQKKDRGLHAVIIGDDFKHHVLIGLIYISSRSFYHFIAKHTYNYFIQKNTILIKNT